MIARTWHGRVPAARAAEYYRYLLRTGLPDYRATPGNRGAWCLCRTETGITHFDMLTFWDDVDAIKRFAGEDYEMSKYDDFDSDYMIEKELRVRHYQMYSETPPDPSPGK